MQTKPFCSITFLGTMSLSACLRAPEDAAAERARVELQCPDTLRVEQRQDLSMMTYEVVGCGRRVRYVCSLQRTTWAVKTVCTPEPPPDIQAADRE